MTTSRTTKTAAAVVAFCALAGSAVAQVAADLSDREVTRRIEFIQNALNGGERTADLWWNGWLAGYGVATFGQVAAYTGTHSEKQKQDMRVGAATTALGAVGQVVFPLDAGRLTPQLRAMPADTPEARRAKLAVAESYLRRSAAQEELGRSWKAHLVSGAVNLAAGLVIWRHYHRPGGDGLATFAIGQLVSEIEIFTQPTKAVRDLREYEKRSDFDRTSNAENAHRTWYVTATPSGFLVGCRF